MQTRKMLDEQQRGVKELQDKKTCKHKNAYYFHDNANPYCPDCDSYPESIYGTPNE